MQPDNFTIVVPTEDPLFHTQTNPFCPIDPTCPCHEDELLIHEVAVFVEDGLLTPSEATDFVNGRMQ